MPTAVDHDVFSRILSHVSDSKTLYTVLSAIPKSHVFFLIALQRLCELPVYLDTYDPRSATASNQVLDYLLSSHEAGPESPGIVGSIRYLVCSVEHDKYTTRTKPTDEDEEEEIEEAEQEPQHEEAEVLDQEAEAEKKLDESLTISTDQESDHEESEPEDVDVEAFHQRLPGFFSRLRNLESLDYHNKPGLALSTEAIEALAGCEKLRTFAVDSAIPKRCRSWAESWDDPDTWDIEPFLSSLGRSVTSLNLRNVCQTMFVKLVSYGDVLATYEHLSSLKMDITEGVWDWDGRGSPNSGASADYIFPSLRLPALRRFELIVGDLTICKPRSSATPLDLVDCTSLSELSLIINQCNWYIYEGTIRLFEGLLPANFCALTHLEIQDSNKSANARLNWGYVDPSERGRYFPGLISFLGALTNLVSLWVDERALLPQYSSAGSFLYRDPECEKFHGPDWDAYHEETRLVEALREVFSRLESLRVGFGVMDHTEVDHVLSACDPAKLCQFGFEWAWDKYGHADVRGSVTCRFLLVNAIQPISPDLLAQLAHFPKLTDVHILFPRPGTQLSGAPNPTVDAITVSDVTAIFACNASICRVGFGNSVVWERHGSLHRDGTAPGITLVSDGSSAPNPAVPSFYHAGYMAKYRPGETFRAYDDNTTPLRPERSEEIEELRDLLKRILD
ncbi:hypothetical protein DFH07DRAFT_786698 [Mycena maculata]|uniref:C2H2-type domain-containing protein n=1 Tax=Mycena maculata TaxID=230809 RepID=A0AAD7KGH3_9AGAR|nr:hypothetical protein DFH07DRAFT_786698 [Mycena maculata]